jgi:hypothetical protein
MRADITVRSTAAYAVKCPDACHTHRACRTTDSAAASAARDAAARTIARPPAPRIAKMVIVMTISRRPTTAEMLMPARHRELPV